MTDDKKKPAAKKPAASKAEGEKTKQVAVKAAPVKADAKKAPAKKPSGRPRKHPVNPEAGTKLPPQKRSIKPTPPVMTPPTEEVIEEALNDGLSPKEIEFVDTYLTCYNGTKSYLAVFDSKSEKAAGVSASQLLAQPRVRKYQAKRMKAAFDRTEEAQDRLLQTFQSVAYGDVNELVEHRRESCRYCHGIDHKYHFTPQEMERSRNEYTEKAVAAQDKAEREGKPVPVFAGFDELGGIGFNPKVDPHPDCPECFGDGVANVFFKDTRFLSPAGIALYAGAKITQGGLEIKTANQDKARETLAKILKLYEEKTEVSINLVNEQELNQIYEDALEKAKEKAETVIGRSSRIVRDGLK